MRLCQNSENLYPHSSSAYLVPLGEHVSDYNCSHGMLAIFVKLIIKLGLLEKLPKKKYRKCSTAFHPTLTLHFNLDSLLKLSFSLSIDQMKPPPKPNLTAFSCKYCLYS